MPAQARALQRTRPGWVVMWSYWRRTFTAFACFAPDPVVIDEAVPERLAVRLNDAERYYAARSTMLPGGMS